MKRRLIALALLIAGTAACTPEEHAVWLQWRDQDPAAAQTFAEEYVTATQQAERGESYQATPIDPPPPSNARGVCSQWYDEAMAAGFSDGQWDTVNRLMYRESRCDPSAYNRSGASGLMQILRMWADDCGGSHSDLFDPSFNLRCARHILNVQGWRAWSTY